MQIASPCRFLSLFTASVALVLAVGGPAIAKERVITISATPTRPENAKLTPVKVTEHYTEFPTPDGQPQTFSGRVDGLTNFMGTGTDALVGIVSLNGVFWDSFDNYQWSSIKADGTFSITANDLSGSPKAIVVQQPGKPWTFLRHDFNGGVSAKDIFIRMPKAKLVEVEVKDAKGNTPEQGFQVEVFDGLQYRESSSKVASFERLGIFLTDGPQKYLTLALPSDPVGLYVAGPGVAPFFQMVDPTKQDKIVFRLIPGGSIAGRLARNGAPVQGASVTVGCPGVPLSWRTTTTGANGRFQVKGLPPGQYTIEASSFHTTQANVSSGRSTVVNFVK